MVLSFGVFVPRCASMLPMPVAFCMFKEKTTAEHHRFVNNGRVQIQRVYAHLFYKQIVDRFWLVLESLSTSRGIDNVSQLSLRWVTSLLGSEIVNISAEVEPPAFRKASSSSDSRCGIYYRSGRQVACLLLKATVVISCLDSTQKPPWELGKTPNKFISLELYVNCRLRCCSVCTVSELKVTASVIWNDSTWI